MPPHTRPRRAHRTAPFVAVIATVALAFTAAPVVAPTGPHAAASAAATTGSLTVSPDNYVAGQAVRFQGRLGSTARTIRLQFHMNRSGDTWTDVPNSTFRTDARGNFDFRFEAPAMVNISYRVAGGRLATPGHRFAAKPQELTLTPPGGNPNYPFYRVSPGARFTVNVDTTPEVGGGWGTPPSIPGRTVVLQERASTTRWRTVATGTTDASGHVTFTATAPSSGTQVLRARQQRWTVGANKIGWFASFPAYFVVSGARAVDQPATRPASAPAGAHGATPTAAQRFRWGPQRFDYAWEEGQDLDSPPTKGTVRTGRWREASGGTGRVVPFNGGLVLQSKFKRGGPGDRGSVFATLHRGEMKHGRWEFRVQGRLWETGAKPYRFRLELVPAGAPVRKCSPNSVVIGDFTMGSPGMRFGVRSRKAGNVWQRTLSDVRLAEEPFNMAVEVGNGHITWFRDSKPVGTVKDRRAQLGAHLVPRLSLVGGQVEMNGAQVNSDWQRSWTLRAGSQVKSGPALARTRYRGC